MMKLSKKSVVGLVEVSRRLNGANNKINKGLNATIVRFYLPQKIDLLVFQIDLYGLKNGL